MGNEERSTIEVPTDGPNYHTYRGFMFYWAYVEEPGDCYFQQRGRNFMCGYESVAGPKWIVTGDDDAAANTIAKSSEQIEFEKVFCTSCYLTAHIPIQQPGISNPVEATSILVSPIIEKRMLALRFDYRMRTPANLLVILMHNHDFVDKKFDRTILVKKVLFDFKLIEFSIFFPIGLNILFYSRI
jgi:hypothetical protein